MADTPKKEIVTLPAMSLVQHLDELRTRLIRSIAGLLIGLIVCLFFGKYIIAFVEKPYIKCMPEGARLQVLSPAEGFNSYMQIAGVGGIILTSPWIFYQLWMFVSAGLYPREKRYVYLAVLFSVPLFIGGALLFFFLIAPVTLQFLVYFNREFLGVESNFTFPKYISFMAIMTLVFGLAFQTPIAIFFLIKTGLVSVATFNKFRKYVIVGIVVVSAAVLPGSDVFSLLALSGSLYLLFELGVLLGYLAHRKKQQETND